MELEVCENGVWDYDRKESCRSDPTVGYLDFRKCEGCEDFVFLCILILFYREKT